MNEAGIRQRLIMLVGAAALGGYSASAGAGVIRVWPTAEVTAGEIRLADMAALQGFEPDAQSQLSDLVIHAAPRAGGALLVRVSDVRSTLQESGANLASIRIIGAARCEVSKPRPARPARPTIDRRDRSKPEARRRPAKDDDTDRPGETRRLAPADTLESVMLEYIEARVAPKEGRLEVRFGASSRRALELRQSDFRFVIHPSEGVRNDRRLGLRSYRVDVLRGEELVETVPVVAEVTILREVVVARKPINRGQTVVGRHLQIEERRFDDLSRVGITDLSAAIGKQARQFVRQGEMLIDNSVETPATVLRGESVTIWHRGSGLRIKTSGKALEDGRLGSQIRVHRDGTRRNAQIIDAIVTGPGTVELVEGPTLASR